MTAESTPVPLEAAYRDATFPIDRRVDDLLARMTLEEKVAQLGSAWVFELVENAELRTDFAPESLRVGIGQVTRISGASSLGAEEAAQAANAIQRFLVEETRLGIPAIVHEEINSGLMAKDATVFPQAIGVASSWEPDLVTAMADVIRRQMRGVGAHQGLSPVLDVCRDPRWGRTEETFGEDPYLVARLGAAFIRGLQGDDISDGVIATAKHFVGYSASEGGMNWAPAHIGAAELKEVYLHPFEAAVRTAGLRSIMNSYNELDGLPVGADASLLTGTLRDDWGFDGLVVSDYFAIRQLTEYHRIAGDAAEAATMALLAGLDVELPGTDCYGEPLLKALEEKALTESDVDTAVTRVLRAKFELGLFEQPFVDVGAAATAMDTPEHRELAATLARKSIVLLSNDGILPIAAGTSSIAVIGPNADKARNLFGDYSYLAHVESLLEMHAEDNVFSIPIPDEYEIVAAGITAPPVLDTLRERFGPGVEFAEGCGVNDDSTGGFADAVALAARSDLAVMVMGDKAGLTDDCTSGEARDRASLDLPGVQEDLVRAVVATGTPVVVVLVAGRPCGSTWLHDHCAAVVMAWLPGQEGAGAIADVLSGEVNPGGKLPISYPRSVGQVPVFYGHKVSGGRSHWKGDYVDLPSSPRYPFGYGLSYTTFSVDEILVKREQLTAADVGTIAARISNTGPVAGDEVVQLYIRDVQAALTRPVLELKNFVRVSLQPGESKTVTFQLPIAQLGYYDRDGAYVVEPGSIEVFIGTSSADLTEAGTLTIVPGQTDGNVAKAFDGTVSVA
ncbi:MAG TPA: glycoside hydrolase family 3 N-terminal domain-containing protein [Acidimicrobiia bacterium]